MYKVQWSFINMCACMCFSIFNFLVYVYVSVDRVIAMSFPSSGSESLYRNSIRDVGNFLDKKHYGHYRVYNLCCEFNTYQ